ncbi:glutamate--tRNA ligase [Clostridia bacterium]|nr:glutamate--tRNA ligase [Clostridia bacterium]
MIRTRFAPSPTGYMHIGNLRTALYEYLCAKREGGQFVLRIEDTDQERYTEGAVEVIYNTLRIAGLVHDEGPDIGGPYAPYVQSERKGHYLEYAKQLVEQGTAYYCFCAKERLDELHKENETAKYDRHCLSLSAEDIARNLERGVPYVIRQLIPNGKTTFVDAVYGEITVDNDELDDQVLIKSDGLPTYNFANVIDDKLMEITHVVRGSEYLSSTPKYNLLYKSFGWEIPKYIHLPLILNEKGEKLSKRRGDASFEDLLAQGFLPDAIINYIALLGWAPPADNREIFSLSELIGVFDVSGISKSPSKFDTQKLTWLNGEYFKKMDEDEFRKLAAPYIQKDNPKLYSMVKSRISFLTEITEKLDFIDNFNLPDTALYTHKKMKTTPEIALNALEAAEAARDRFTDFTNDKLYETLTNIAAENELKNSQILWSIRTALSGKPVTPCGASELMEVLGKDESFDRLGKAIGKLRQEAAK